MKILHENKYHPDLNVVQISDVELTGSGIVAKDCGVGFFVNITMPGGHEIFLDDTLLNQMYIMMQKRQAADHPGAQCNPALCPICLKNYPDIAKAAQ